MDSGKITKRDFLKKASMCIGAAGCGMYSPSIFPKNFTNLIGIGNVHFPEIDLNKWTIEAKYYVPTPKGLKCLLCPNECKIKTDEFGECHTRVNLDDRLYCIAYGNPCAVHIDPIEKKPLFHYLPGSRSFSIATAGCNLACLNCQNWEISQTGPDKTRNHDLMPDKVVEEAIKSDCKSIAYTYSDPVAFYEYAYDTARIARENGIGNVLVSAGYILEEPLKEWCKYMDAANIDLKSFSNEIYEMLNAGKLDPVLNTLKTLADEGVWLEITNLVIPDWTDDMDMIKKMCNWLVENNFENYPLHFSRFHPLYKLTHLSATPVQVLENAKKIAISEGLKFVYIGNVPGLESINTFCPGCKTKIIERKGFNILNNRIENSKCPNCGTFIPGRWK